MSLWKGVRGWAEFGPDGPEGHYRYALGRSWHHVSETEPRHVLWIMLNPSTADALSDDRTVARCQSFASRWGYNGVVVGNLFAYRATQPTAMTAVDDPVGPCNDEALRRMLDWDGIALVVAGWGVHGRIRGRDDEVVELVMAADRNLHVVHTTRGGGPGHPLYVKAVTDPQLWRRADEPLWRPE